MTRYPVKRKASAPTRNVNDDAVEVLGPPVQSESAFNFRYTCTEITAFGSTARVKSKQVRYANGELQTETFDGEFGRGVYDRMVNDTNRYLSDQMAWSFSVFGRLFGLPANRRGDGE